MVLVVLYVIFPFCYHVEQLKYMYDWLVKQNAQFAVVCTLLYMGLNDTIVLFCPLSSLIDHCDKKHAE